jgi:D-aspartate ligase
MREGVLTSRPDTTTPVILVQGVPNPVQHGLLAAARSLGRFGVPVFAVFKEADGPCQRSKYLRGSATLDVRRVSPTQLIETILRLTDHDRPLLIPADDVAVMALDRVDLVHERCLLARQRPGVVQQLSDKRQLLDVVRRLSIPSPSTFVVSDRSELQETLGKITFPVVLKTADPFVLRATSGAASVTIAKRAAELTESYERMPPCLQASALVQEYIPGSTADWIFNGCFDRSSACLFRGTGIKMRQLPLGTGAATLGVSLPNAVVTDLSLALVTAMGYTGMIDVDYRYDRRDGRYKLLDVNPRLGASFRLFVADDGTDVLRAHYLDATGQPVPRSHARDGRKWLVELRDLRSCLKLVRNGQLNVSAWLRSMAGVEEMAWFDSRDLAPFAAMLRHYALRYLHGRSCELP